MLNKIYVVDTTLRDGEQTAGVVFANQEKVRIARLLNEIGVDQIEAGIPVMGGDEQETIKQIVRLKLRASIMGWNRAVIKDIQESIRCGVDAVAISISTSDIHIKYKLQSSRERVLEQMVESVEFAKKEGMYISVNAEDASRSDMEFLLKFAYEAKKAGANRLRYCDTIGILEPFITYERIKHITSTIGIDVEIHAHDDFGMATANTLAAVRGGATHVGVTVNGLGERAGNAALEEIIMALKYVYRIDLGFKTEQLVDLSQYVSRASGRELPSWKAIVGTNTFAHESGIHADGAIKNPLTYEVFTPEEVGLERQIVIGKHSGTKSIILKFAEYGISLTNEEANEILTRIRLTAVDMKRSLFDKEIMYIYEDYLNHKNEKENLKDNQ